MQNYDQAAMLSCQQYPPGRDQDQVRCCTAEIGMGSIVCVTVRSLQFQYHTDMTDTYISTCLILLKSLVVTS